MKQLIINTKDKVGILADISYILGKARINIESVHASVIGKNAVIVLAVEDWKSASALLRKSGYDVEVSDYLLVRVEDIPGELAKISKILSDSCVNIHDIIVVGKDKGYVIDAIKVDKPAKAMKVLKDYLLLEQ